LYGDVPLIQQKTLEKLEACVDETHMALLTFTLSDATGYGRIVRSCNHTEGENNIIAIIEQKDASTEQLEIKEINTGVMAVLGKHLKSWLPKLSNQNAQGEYYLTDIVEMAVSEGVQVEGISASTQVEITGVNDRLQQTQLEREYQLEQANRLLIQGLSIVDDHRFDLRGTLKHGSDSSIDINCIFNGTVHIGNNVTVGANCIISDAIIGDGTEIKPNSVVEDTTIAKDCVIGPFARLRPGTQLDDKAKIGNFVETKKTIVGKGSKINHLSYVGDAKLGENVNVGAGTITCNYDGVNKFKTIIENDAFIGSNTALVAPVSVGNKATIGAGSVVTKDVPNDQLGLSRAKQRKIDNWVRPTKQS